MIKTLDAYIIRKFLSTFFFTVLIFTMISVIIDFSEKVEKFIEEPITRKEILIDYFPNFILYIDGLLWPLFTLIAVIFFTSRMAYNSEIISIFNAGVSFRRLLQPYLIAASLIALLHYVGNHYFIPKGNNTRLELVYKYIWQDNDKGKTRDVHMFVAPDTKIYINYYRKSDSTARRFRLEHFKDGELVYLLKANSAEWIGPPSRWKLRNYEIRTFDGLEESIELGPGKEMDTTIAFTPADFVDYQEQHTMMTSPELRKYIANQRSRGVGNTMKYEIELYRRTAEPFTIFILTIIGLSIAARKVRGGIGLHLAIGIGIGALYIFFSRFAIVFATEQTIPVIVGIWLPNIVFTGVALYVARNAQS
ncbi:MAG TPA: LptF/LptG family permease [Saprospiraceae bacterium]|nr:LptF/LptG family permease [Saprospiraceae bacterium]HMQ82377.1 LptF/LptG family permease [Saprospiraceae bacterium]